MHSSGNKSDVGISKVKTDRARVLKSQTDSVLREKIRTQRARLHFLRHQSTIFEHFLRSDGSALDPKEIHNNLSQDTVSKDSNSGAESNVPRLPKHLQSSNKSSKSTKGRGSGNVDDDLDEDEFSSYHLATRLTRQPSNLRGELREYQLEGLNWMIGLHENGLNGILADEMGLGKTFQTISLLAWYLEAQNCDGPHLVLVPKSTLSNWEREVEKFCPSLKTMVFQGSKEERHEMIVNRLQPGQTAEERGWNILLTTYEVLGIEEAVVARIPWHYVIIDEAHRIKNENSSFSVSARKLMSSHRLLITGTPLQNNLHELWALLNFLLPDLFQSATAFDSWFNLENEAADEAAKTLVVRRLHEVLKPFMLRRLKVDVAKTLPPKKETHLYVPMSRMQRELYKSILKRDVDTWLSKKTNNTSAKPRLANLLMHLRKACNHPYLFDGMEDRNLDPAGEHLVTNASKLALLDKLLKRFKALGSRVLIFSQMTSLLDIIEDYLVMRGYRYQRIDGSSDYSSREASIDHFNAEGSDDFCFLLSTRAGGLGINLYTADVVILYDSDWNPQADLQAQDRAHRIGQKKEVKVYRLVTAGSVEEKMVERAMIKLKLDAVVIQGSLQAQQRSKEAQGPSKEDMLAAITFGADAIFRASDDSADVDGGLTEEDIDRILEMGETRTAELTASVAERTAKVAGANNLDFKMDSGSVMLFEGIDYSKEARREEAERLREAVLVSLKEGPGKLDEVLSAGELGLGSATSNRTTINSMNRRVMTAEEAMILSFPDEPWPSSMSANEEKARRAELRRQRLLLPPDYRFPERMDPYNLYETQEILEIALEHARFIERRQLREQLLEEKARKVEAGQPLESTGEEATQDDDLLLEELGRDLDQPFPQEKLDRQLKLQEQGFPSWRKDDFAVFVNACARFGRWSHAEIAATMSIRGKPQEETLRYISAFFSRGHLSFSEQRYAKELAKIKKGEQALVKGLLEESALNERVFAHILGSRESPVINVHDSLVTEGDGGFGSWSGRVNGWDFLPLSRELGGPDSLLRVDLAGPGGSGSGRATRIPLDSSGAPDCQFYVPELPSRIERLCDDAPQLRDARLARVRPARGRFPHALAPSSNCVDPDFEAPACLTTHEYSIRAEMARNVANRVITTLTHRLGSQPSSLPLSRSQLQHLQLGTGSDEVNKLVSEVLLDALETLPTQVCGAPQTRFDHSLHASNGEELAAASASVLSSSPSFLRVLRPKINSQKVALRNNVGDTLKQYRSGKLRSSFDHNVVFPLFDAMEKLRTLDMQKLAEQAQAHKFRMAQMHAQRAQQAQQHNMSRKTQASESTAAGAPPPKKRALKAPIGLPTANLPASGQKGTATQGEPGKGTQKTAPKPQRSIPETVKQSITPSVSAAPQRKAADPRFETVRQQQQQQQQQLHTQMQLVRQQQQQLQQSMSRNSHQTPTVDLGLLNRGGRGSVSNTVQAAVSGIAALNSLFSIPSNNNQNPN